MSKTNLQCEYCEESSTIRHHAASSPRFCPFCGEALDSLREDEEEEDEEDIEEEEEDEAY